MPTLNLDPYYSRLVFDTSFKIGANLGFSQKIVSKMPYKELKEILFTIIDFGYFSHDDFIGFDLERYRAKESSITLLWLPNYSDDVEVNLYILTHMGIKYFYCSDKEIADKNISNGFTVDNLIQHKEFATHKDQYGRLWKPSITRSGWWYCFILGKWVFVELEVFIKLTLLDS